MVRLARARYVLCRVALVLLAATAGSVCVTAPAGGAVAQPQPTMVISPSSGPCDAMVEVKGEGFEPGTEVALDLAKPNTDDVIGRLAVATADSDGKFSARVGLGDLGCDAAALDDRFSSQGSPREIEIYAGFRHDVLFVAARARYTYTTTQPAPPQPTIVLSPSSGPCDAVVEMKGSGFPVAPGQALDLATYLLQPGTTDVSMAPLVPAYPNQDGAFSQWAGLREHGCEAATLDRQAQQPAGYLAIAAAPQVPTVQVGERIPNIIAVGHYSYTTTTPPPPPVIFISPSGGPCDGTVEVTGTGFQPEQDISLGWAYPSSEAPMGTLASVSADAEGAFVVEFTLGKTGCDAAGRYPGVRDPMPPRLRVDAEAIGPPVQVGSSLARTFYTFTTTEVGGAVPPQALPAAGSGTGQPSARPTWLGVAAALAALGLILVIASFHRKMQRG